MTDRYRVPEPKCRHNRKGRVTAGVLRADETHASTAVCDRPECIADAKAWAYALTHLQPEFVPDRTPAEMPGQLSLLGAN